MVPEVNDIAFVGVVHPEHGPGFDLWVGGGLSTNPMLAVRLGGWVPQEEVAEVWAGVVGLFRDYGYRRLRTRARIKFLVADWGAEKFRNVLETEYLKRPLIDGPAPAVPDRTGRSRRGPPCRRTASTSSGSRRWPAESSGSSCSAGRGGRGTRLAPHPNDPDAEAAGA